MDETDDNVYKAAILLWQIVSPILIILGTVGNALSIVILMKNKKMRNSSTAIYFTCLAVSDILALNIGLTRQWVRYTFHMDIRTLSVGGCRVHFFLVYVVTQYSSVMLICVTLERLIGTWFPYKSKLLCFSKSALAYVSAIAAFLVFLNCHYLFGYGAREISSDNASVVEPCSPLGSQYNYFIVYQWTWIDLCVFCLIPFIFLIIGNIAIIFKIVSSYRKSHRKVGVGSQKSAHASTEVKNRKSSLTITLLALSFVFLICITPICVYPIGEPYWKKSATTHGLALLFMFKTLANMLMYINHSVNFILYFLSGSKFRQEVKELLCTKLRYNNSSNSESLRMSMRKSAQPHISAVVIETNS